MRFFTSVLASLLLLSACSESRPHPPSEPDTWSLLGAGRPSALMSVSGTSDHDVWVVGADKGKGPAVLHWDGTAWTVMSTGTAGDLWWVQAMPDGPVFLAGAGATILRYQDGVFTRLTVPGVARQIVYGLWGSGPNDVYAVGAINGRAGFVWHYDGIAWAEMRLPQDTPRSGAGELPGLFKVWGAGKDVWIVGNLGTILHTSAGQDLTVATTGTADQRFFTVAGNDSTVVVVGDQGNGILLERGSDGTFQNKAPGPTPFLQGVSLLPDGTGLATGEQGAVFRRGGQGWTKEDTGIDPAALGVESLHAVWMDPTGGAWAVGGSVISSALDKGALLHFGHAVPSLPDETPVTPPGTTCPDAQVDPQATKSVARRWDEALLWAIRRDTPRPVVHSRNLFHVSAAMWDAWAAYDPTAKGFVSSEKHAADDTARQKAISYAAFRVLTHRYDPSIAVGGAVSNDCFQKLMTRMGYDPADTGTTGDDAAAVGNRIGTAIVNKFVDDGSNEAHNYADTTGWMPVNPPMVVDNPGAGNLQDPALWQQLILAQAATQNGIPQMAGVQAYVGTNWDLVTPFAMTRDAQGTPYYDPGPTPGFNPTDTAFSVEVARRSSWLDATDGVNMEIGPSGYGNNTLGTNDSRGYEMNPVTGQPYAPNLVPRGDFGRVMAEFWADGPASETPPGHWNVLANYVADYAGFERKLGGTGASLDPLEWDVKVYFAVNGAVHDAGIAAWGTKRIFTTSRPITIIRHMADLGQRSDPTQPHFDPDGLPLVPGFIELITAESSAQGQRHENLAPYVGELALHAWKGDPPDRKNQVSGVGWIRAREWIPYQKRSFVTPAFPGFISGHSTFSRAAAEVLANLTGSPYFPGGLAEFVAHKDTFLSFEKGPTVDVHLQWATYFDASDEAGQSRLWGGIHIEPDDFGGRRVGSEIGLAAVAKARTYFDGTAP